MSTRVVRSDDLLTASAVYDPYPLFASLRTEAPVHYSQRYRSWIVFGYDDVAVALKDPRFLSDRITPYIENYLPKDAHPDVVTTMRVLQKWMVFTDPPEHFRLRKLVSHAFTPRAIASLETRITAVANELVGQLPATGQVDLVKAFAYPLPAIVIAEMLGVPVADRDMFKTWSDDLTALVFGEVGDEDRHARSSASMVQLITYFESLCDRYTKDPQDNIISRLMAAREGDDALTQHEITATCVLLLFGGHETTTSLIGNAVLAVSTLPSDAIKAAVASPELMRNVVEEAVRFDGAAKFVPRVINETFTFQGHTFSTGERVMLSLAAANRDPQFFTEPDQFMPARANLPQHVGYGLGPHYCLGAPLARLEVRIALTQLFRQLRTVVPDVSGASWAPVLLNRVIRTLPAQIQKADT